MGLLRRYFDVYLRYAKSTLEVYVKFANTKELRQDLKDLLEEVCEGERIVITRRGKPVAVLSPFTLEASPEEESLRPYQEAWAEIESALSHSKPAFSHWEEALDRSRRRPKAK